MTSQLWAGVVVQIQMLVTESQADKAASRDTARMRLRQVYVRRDKARTLSVVCLL